MKAIVVYEQKEYSRQFGKMIQDVLWMQNIKTEFLDVTKNNPSDYMKYLQETSAEIIITIDMAGFHLKTLQENSFYNVLTAKQLHFLSEENKLKKWEQEEFALNLYVAVPQRECNNVKLGRRENIPQVIYHPCYEQKQGAITESVINKNIIKEVIALFIDCLGEKFCCL